MAMCARCGATAQRSGLCRLCGSAIDGSDLFGPTAAPIAPLTELRRARPARRRWWASAAVSSLLLAGAVFASRTDLTQRAAPVDRTLAPQPPATTTSPPTWSTGTASKGAEWPPVVGVPTGLQGTLDLGFFDGTIATLDLATGTLSRHAQLELPQPGGLYLLGDWLLVTDPGGAAILRRVALADQSTSETLPLNGRVLAAGPAGVVIQPNGAEPPRLITASGEEHTLALPDRHQIVGLAGDRVVIEAHGHIGTTDLTSGGLIAVTDGELVAANDHILVRLACSIGDCELRAGPWDDLDRTRIPNEPEGIYWATMLTPDGSHLIVRHHGPNGPSFTLIDLANDTTKPIDLPAEQTGDVQSTALTADGTKLLHFTGSTVIVHPLDGTPTAHIDLPGRVLIGALR